MELISNTEDFKYVRAVVTNVIAEKGGMAENFSKLLAENLMDADVIDIEKILRERDE